MKDLAKIAENTQFFAPEILMYILPIFPAWEWQVGKIGKWL
jgi:hypothetical protein